MLLFDVLTNLIITYYSFTIYIYNLKNIQVQNNCASIYFKYYIIYIIACFMQANWQFIGNGKYSLQTLDRNSWQTRDRYSWQILLRDSLQTRDRKSLQTSSWQILVRLETDSWQILVRDSWQILVTNSWQTHDRHVRDRLVTETIYYYYYCSYFNFKKSALQGYERVDALYQYDDPDKATYNTGLGVLCCAAHIN